MDGDPLGDLRSALAGVFEPSDRRIFEELFGVPETHVDNSYPNDHRKTAPDVVVYFDQVEDFFSTVKDEIRTRFFDALKQLSQKTSLTLLFCIRSDFVDLLLKQCRDVDSNQEAFNLGNLYTLRAFSQPQAKAVLEKILEPVSEGDPLARERSDDFVEALTTELLRPPQDRRLSREDQKTVLPVQLQMIGAVLESLGVQYFSPTGLRKYGGRAGLLRLFVADAAKYVWRKTGVPEDETLRILRRFISPSGTSFTLTSTEIAATLTLSVPEVIRVLDAFCENYLIQREPPTTDGLVKYRLMHDYLGRILTEAPIRVLQKERDAEERIGFWLSRTQEADLSEPRTSQSVVRRIVRPLSQQLPAAEAIRLWRYSSGDGRRLLATNLRAFSLRVVLVLLVLSAGPLAYAFWTASDSYQIAQAVNDGVGLELPIRSSDEDVLAEWALASAAAGYPSVAFDVVGKLHESPQSARESLTLLSLAQAFSQLRDATNAARAAQSITDDATRKVAMRAAAEGLALSGAIDKVDGFLSQIERDDQIAERVQVASLLVAAGQQKAAFAMLPRMEQIAGIENLHERVYTWANLARVFGMSKTSDKATFAWQQALIGVRQMEPDEDGLRKLAVTVSDLGMSGEAIASCAQIQHPYVEITTFPTVAFNLTRHGDTQSAGSLMERAGAAAEQTLGNASSADGDEALDYGLGLAWVGRPPESVVSLMKRPFTEYPPAAFAADVAAALQNLGAADRANSFWRFARTTWAQESDPEKRKAAFVEIGTKLILAKRYEDLEVIIPDFLADAQENGLKMDGLTSLLLQLLKPSQDDPQLQPIVQLVTGSLSQLIASGEGSVTDRRLITQLFIDVGERSQALVVARSIQRGDERAAALADVAASFVLSGDRNSGRARFYEAKKTAEAGEFRSYALLSISKAYARLGYYRSARLICQSCENAQRLEADAWILAGYAIHKHPGLLRRVRPPCFLAIFTSHQIGSPRVRCRRSPEWSRPPLTPPYLVQSWTSQLEAAWRGGKRRHARHARRR